MKLSNLVYLIGALKTEFDLDLLDLQLLVAAQSRWDEERTVRITDLVHEFRIASPATIHYRVTKDLTQKKMIKLQSNPEDMREKFVLEGSAFKKVQKFLGEEGKTK
jgi:hypothetical protein